MLHQIMLKYSIKLNLLNNLPYFLLKTSWYRLASAQFPIIYIYALFLTYRCEILSKINVYKIYSSIIRFCGTDEFF